MFKINKTKKQKKKKQKKQQKNKKKTLLLGESNLIYDINKFKNHSV